MRICCETAVIYNNHVIVVTESDLVGRSQQFRLLILIASTRVRKIEKTKKAIGIPVR